MSLRWRWLLWVFAWPALMTACGGARGEHIGALCLSDEDCSPGSVCEAQVCSESASSGASARVVGKIEGAPAGAQLGSRVEGGESCTVEAGAVVCQLALGKQLVLIAPELTGHRFVGWTGAAACQGATSELRLTTVAATVECTARYVPRVRVSGSIADGAGPPMLASADGETAACELSSCTVDGGSSVTLTAPERDGFRIARFEGPGCEAQDGYRVTVHTTSSDVRCTAHYEASLTARGQVQGLRAEESAALNPSVIASSAAAGALCRGPLCAVRPGESVTLLAPTLAGYRFRGWIGPAGCLGAEPTLELAALSATVVCTADYVRRFRVTGASSGAVAPLRALADSGFPSCEGASCVVDEGATVTLLAGTVPGHRLVRFHGEGCEDSGGSAAHARDVHQDRTCVAAYEPGVAVSGTVVNADAEVTATSTSADARCADGRCAVGLGGSTTLSAPALPGRTFLGWSGDPGCAGSALAITLDGVVDSTDCLATFSPRYRAAGRAAPAMGGSVAASATTGNPRCDERSGCEVDEGASVRLVATPHENFRFTGWSGGAACSGSNAQLELLALRGSVECSANFVARVRVSGEATPAGAATVSASSLSAGAECSFAACAVDVGGSVLLSAREAAGFRFLRWLGCSDQRSSLVQINPLVLAGATRDEHCTATFERISYTLVADGTTGGTATVSSGSCAGTTCTGEHGASATFRARAEPGQRLVGWSGDCSGSEADISVPQVRGALHCTAHFAPIPVTVTGTNNPPDAGSLAARSESPGARCADARCTLNHGGTVTLDASERPGFRFLSFSGCVGQQSGPSITLATVTTDQLCTANYEPLTYVVTALADPLGAARLTCEAGCLASHGASVTLSVLDSGSYRLRGWSGDDCPTSTDGSITISDIDATRTCVAHFVRQHTVTVSTNGSGGASCGDGTQRCTADEGASVPLSAIVPEGLYFDRWSGCDAADAKSTSTSVVVSGDLACTANFAVMVL